MTGTLYDHLTAVIITGALFVAAVVAVPTLSYVNLLYVDQQQLRNVALETLKTMLLDTGYPLNWGSDDDFSQSNLERFGLALSDSSSSYVLDPDKVQRLVVNNSLGWVEYETVRQLLGLQGYGFSIRILPPFNVTVKDVSPPGMKNQEFEVTVTFNDKKPIPNAVVEADIVYSYLVDPGETELDNKYTIRYTQGKGITNELGKCNIQTQIDDPLGRVQENLLIIIKTTVADVTTITMMYQEGSAPEGLAEINVYGDSLNLTRPEKYDPNANIWICDIAIITEDGLIHLYNGTKSDMLNYGSKDLWSEIFNGLKSMNPVFTIFNFNAVEKGGGRQGALLVGPYPNHMGSRVTHYGGARQSFTSGGSVTLSRAVNISGMTYIVELTLWKEM